MAKKYGRLGERTRCRLCRQNMNTVDYKDIILLKKFTAKNGKIVSRKQSGTCAKHQRQVKKAVFRARYIGLLPYISV